MGIILVEPQEPSESAYAYWQCENCLVTSDPEAWEGRWDACNLAQLSLTSHILDMHDGFIFSNATTNVKDIKRARRPKPRLRRTRR